MKDHEDKIKNLFTQHMQREMNRPDIKLQKKRFIRDHFQPAPVIPFAWSVPALAFCLMLGFLLKVQAPLMEPTSAEPKVPSALSETILEQNIQENQKTETEDLVMNPVKVKKITSKMGTPMVYQRTENEVPLTIVWVFVPTGG